MTGYDTAGPIQDTYASAHREFGADPAFWIRYFAPSPAADLFNDDAVAESRGAWDSGAPYVGCVSAPGQSRLSVRRGRSGRCAGLRRGDAGRLPCGRSASAAIGRSPVLLARPGILNVPEPGLLAGVGAVHSGVQLRGPGDLSAVPVPVLQSSSPYPNCSTIAKAHSVDVPSAIWSPEPQSCGGLTDPPRWQPAQCGSVPTRLWQYGEQGTCQLSSNVDLDADGPGFVTARFCFHVSSRP